MKVDRITAFYAINGLTVAVTEEKELLYWFELSRGFENKETVLKKAEAIGRTEFLTQIITEAEKLIK